jgi:uncharacterized protein YjiS (DUF1127 family)
MEVPMRLTFPVLPIAAAVFVRGMIVAAVSAARGLKALARARRHRSAASALSGLDRRMLADIGITRADLNDAFSGPFWDDPTAILRERALERRLAGTRSAPFVIASKRPVENGFRRPPTNRPARHAM